MTTKTKRRYSYLGAYIEADPHGGFWCYPNWDYEDMGAGEWFATERQAQQHAEVFA